MISKEEQMVLMTLYIVVILLVIVVNAFARNLNGVLGFALALINYIALQVNLGNIRF